jgi:hypothetical protein
MWEQQSVIAQNLAKTIARDPAGRAVLVWRIIPGLRLPQV